MSLDLQEQLSSLETELARLEGLLARDENFRALEQLNARESQGNRVRAIDDQVLRANLEASLSSSRIYQARGRLLEVIALLKAELPREPVAAAPQGTAVDAERAPADAEQAVTVANLSDVAETVPERQEGRVEDHQPGATQPVDSYSPDTGVVAVPVAASGAIIAAQDGPEAEGPPQPAPIEEPAPPDQLTLIKGIDDNLAAQLNDAGITRFSQIAGWQRDDIESNSAMLGLEGEINYGGWIEQAALLAGGGLTRYARSYDCDEATYLVATPLSSQAINEEFAAYLRDRSLEHGVVAALEEESVVSAASPETEIAADVATVPRPPTPLLGERVFVPRKVDRDEAGVLAPGPADEAAMPPPLPISEALFEGLPGADAGISPAEKAEPMQFRLPEDGPANSDDDQVQGANDEEPLAEGAIEADDHEAEVTIVTRPADAISEVERAARTSANDNRREPATNRFVPPDPQAAGLGSKAAREVEAQVDIVRPESEPNEEERVDAAALLTLSEEPEGPREPILASSTADSAFSLDEADVDDEAVVMIAKRPDVGSPAEVAEPVSAVQATPGEPEPIPAPDVAVTPTVTQPEPPPPTESPNERQNKVDEQAAAPTPDGEGRASKEDAKASRLLRALTGE